MTEILGKLLAVFIFFVALWGLYLGAESLRKDIENSEVGREYYLQLVGMTASSTDVAEITKRLMSDNKITYKEHGEILRAYNANCEDIKELIK
jgi:hypothetical protein